MYDLGDVVALQVTITDANGANADATAVTCTITLPDGTSTNPAVTHTSLGIYTITYQTVQAGRHVVSWVATGTNASAFTDIFDVRAAATSSIQLISLADAKNMLNITSTNQDEEIRDFIMATTSVIEGEVGAIIPRDVTETTRAYGRDIVLGETPVISVTSVTPTLIAGTPISAAAVVVDPYTGIIRRYDRGYWYGDLYTVVYRAGRLGATPEALTMAARIVLQQMWRTQRGPGRTADTGESAGFLIPNRAKELMKPYRKIGAIA